MTLRQDSGRYECGTMNTIGCFGLRAALELLLEAGLENVSAAVQQLGDQLWNGAQELGYETLGKRDRSTGAGIVSIRKPGVESQFIVSKAERCRLRCRAASGLGPDRAAFLYCAVGDRRAAPPTADVLSRQRLSAQHDVNPRQHQFKLAARQFPHALS